MKALEVYPKETTRVSLKQEFVNAPFLNANQLMTVDVPLERIRLDLQIAMSKGRVATTARDARQPLRAHIGRRCRLFSRLCLDVALPTNGRRGYGALSGRKHSPLSTPACLFPRERSTHCYLL